MSTEGCMKFSGIFINAIPPIITKTMSV
jgi:hypothetical protein